MRPLFDCKVTVTAYFISPPLWFCDYLLTPVSVWNSLVNGTINPTASADHFCGSRASVRWNGGPFSGLSIKPIIQANCRRCRHIVTHHAWTGSVWCVSELEAGSSVKRWCCLARTVWISSSHRNYTPFSLKYSTSALRLDAMRCKTLHFVTNTTQKIIEFE